MKGYEIKQVQMRPPSFKVDKSATLSFATGEMVKEVQMQILENSGTLGTLIYVPEDVQETPPKVEVKEFEGKKPSERLYNVLFVYWKATNNEGDFYTYYRQWMEKKIEEIKANIPSDY